MKKYSLFFLAVGVTVVLLFSNVLITRNGMKPIIKEKRLVDEQNFEEGGVPPMVAFTTMALGGFRGLIADILWLRALSLQEQGKYFELVQLADWIQKLQPKFAGVSSYLGWNMAYNVSLTCRDFADRWRWVNRGIETLIDAIRMNPNDPFVYYQLGWIYFHKLGNTLDDAQQFYKIQLAEKMLDLFGNEHYPDWKALAEIPGDEEGFRVLYPGDALIWTKIKNAGFDSLQELEEAFQSLRNLPEGLAEVLEEDERKDLSYYFRARLLKKEMLLDPAIIVEIEEKYGELDWLLAESMAIYWAYQGILHSPDR